MSRLCAALIALSVLALPARVDAHEKWFIDASQYPLRWDLFVSQGPLVCCIAVAVVTGLLALWWRVRGQVDFIPPPEAFGATAEGRRIIYSLLPLIIGLHVAIPLFYDGLHNVLFTANVHLHSAAEYAFGLVEIGIGLSFFYGGFTRVAAVALIALWFAGIFLGGLQSMLDDVLFLGIGVFFFLAGRGPFAIDRFMFPRLEPPERLAGHAVLALRVGVGLSFVVVAFTEKLANLPLALAFLKHYPLNFTAFLHIPMTDTQFMLAAGSTELFIGLCLLFGLFPREVILVAWLPFNLTLTYFNQTELIGHLPIYGIMALLLIWLPGKANRDQWVAGLRLFRTVDRAVAENVAST